jgi:hypothetical protein
MDLETRIKKSKVNRNAVLLAIAYEHSVNKLLTKAELKKMKTIELELNGIELRLIKRIAKEFKLKEESVIVGAIQNAIQIELDT